MLVFQFNMHNLFWQNFNDAEYTHNQYEKSKPLNL